MDRQIANLGSSEILQALTEYSAGKLPRAVAMQKLGLSDYGLLLQLLGANGLSLPIVPIADRKVMVQKMVALVTGADRAG